MWSAQVHFSNLTNFRIVTSFRAGGLCAFQRSFSLPLFDDMVARFTESDIIHYDDENMGDGDTVGVQFRRSQLSS